MSGDFWLWLVVSMVGGNQIALFWLWSRLVKVKSGA